MAKAKTKVKKVVPKKVNAFPLSGELDLNGIKIKLEIMNITDKGIVARALNGMCHVGIHYKAAIYLPQTRFPIGVEVQIFRTYDTSLDPKSKRVERMIEALFLNLEESQRRSIGEFLHFIGRH